MLRRSIFQPMSRRLISHIDPWSVARTMFPLAWLLGFVAILLIYLLAGSLVMAVASEYYDVPEGTGEIGLAGALFASLLTGFIYAIFATLLSVLAAITYNLLARLGGGISIEMEEEELLIGEKPPKQPDLSPGVEILPQAVELDGTIRETEEDPEESDATGESEK